MTCVIATSREWHERLAGELSDTTGETFHLITDRWDLTSERLQQWQPRYVFFPHWSYIIPPDIYENYECIIFHMTDVPFGRGGSPLQNLISRGIYETKISALRCVAELDAGPVYIKQPLSLHGSAEEIFARAGDIIAEMIKTIVTEHPKPQPQAGEPVTFKRRKPSQSTIAGITTLSKLYDHIRMLDADGYPHAFFEIDAFRFEFRQAKLEDKTLTAQVTITEVKNE